MRKLKPIPTSHRDQILERARQVEDSLVIGGVDRWVTRVRFSTVVDEIRYSTTLLRGIHGTRCRIFVGQEQHAEIRWKA